MTVKRSKQGGFNLSELSERIPPWLLILAILAIVTLIVTVKTLSREPLQPKQEQTQEADGVITVSTQNPEESPPEGPYIVASDEPRSIRLPAANVDGYIQKVGIDQHGKIAVPSNVTMAGWYIHSKKPGEQGLSVIDGHVDGQTAEGIFYRLADVSAGDELSIEYGDGSAVWFRVVDKIQVPESEAADVVFSKRQGIEHQLNLVTCGGAFDYEESTYPDRVIIVTERI
ncbi:MAG: Sortase family protein [candidate division WS6 bacterium OLB20]|uniref:Sortase family protein n=1 Tax=candidate division WS6 bacterium OLB20 TaxID=1617426 RepID=A0A136M0F5_9BACT|nr:MAG: Sortase family protein [candidate division WS6 bacterium OLB20]